MDITPEFARLLLEADQLVGQDQPHQAAEKYALLLNQAQLWVQEKKLIEARLDAVQTIQAERAEAELADIQAANETSNAVEVVERDSAQPPSEEARAETLVNSGDLEAAIAIYTQLADRDGPDSLAAERLTELRDQHQANSQALDPAPVPESAERLAPELQAAERPAQTEPAEAALVQQAAGAVQQQLEAEFVDWRRDLPADPVAMLQTLLDRLQHNRRPQA